MYTRISCVILLFSTVYAEEKEANGLNINFFQHDYKIYFEHGDVISYNKDIYSEYKTVTFKYNRSTPLPNMTYTNKQDIDEHKLEVVVQAYRFASNEYRLFPLRFQFNFCRSTLYNSFGIAGIYKCGNYSSCMQHKGSTTHICNWSIDESKFPPYIPNGKYKISLQYIYNNKDLLVDLEGYGEVARPIPWN